MRTCPDTSPPSPAGLSAANEHPALQLPFTVLVDDRRLDGDRLSLLGGSAVGLVDPALDGAERLVTLQFLFDGFAVSLPVRATIHLAAGAGNGPVELQFVEPAGEHLPQLRFILNSYIAGDVVAMGQLLTVAASRAAPAPATAPAGPLHRARQAARGVVVLGLSVGLVALAAGTLGQKALTRAELRPAVVTETGRALRAPAAGQIEFIAADAAEGEIAFGLLATSGDLLSIRMPCDCGTRDTGVRAGDTVLAGEPVMVLTPPDATIELQAVLSWEGIRRTLAGGRVEVLLADNTAVAAQVTPESLRRLAALPEATSATVTLRPSGRLDPQLVGHALRVRVRHGLELPNLAPAIAALAPGRQAAAATNP